MDKLNLSAPWITYVSELKVLFKYDPDVQIEYDQEDKEVKLYVQSATKADALTQLLAGEVVFGNETLKVTVIPANEDTDKLSLMRKALDGNPVFKEIVEAQRPGATFKYAMFTNDVAQFYNDQMDDPVGYKTMLYADVAKDVFGDIDGTFYSTELK